MVTAPADVFVISQYKGKDVMLRSYCKQSEVSDMPRTTGSRALIQVPLAPFDIEPGKMESLNLKIDAILSLLERFGHEAEVPTLLDDFKKWLALHQGRRDFKHLLSMHTDATCSSASDRGASGCFDKSQTNPT